MRGTGVPRKKFVAPIVNDLVRKQISTKELYDKLAPITSSGLPLNEEQALYQGTLERLGVSKQNAALIRTPGFADQLGTKLTGILVTDLDAVYQDKMRPKTIEAMGGGFSAQGTVNGPGTGTPGLQATEYDDDDLQAQRVREFEPWLDKIEDGAEADEINQYLRSLTPSNREQFIAAADRRFYEGAIVYEGDESSPAPAPSATDVAEPSADPPDDDFDDQEGWNLGETDRQLDEYLSDAQLSVAGAEIAGLQAAAAEQQADVSRVAQQGTDGPIGPQGGSRHADDVTPDGDKVMTSIMRPTPVTSYQAGAITTSNGIASVPLMPAPMGVGSVQAALFKQAQRTQRQQAMNTYVDFRAAPVEDYDPMYQPPITGYQPQYYAAVY